MNERKVFVLGPIPSGTQVLAGPIKLPLTYLLDFVFLLQYGNFAIKEKPK